MIHSDAIWLPGAGELRFSEMHAARAVSEYDADLLLGQRKDTGEWCVFLRHGPTSDGQPFPVMGLGHELPAPEEIKRRLYQADIRRRGREIVDEIERHYDEEQKKFADAASDGAGQVAEAIDSHMRAQGTHPFPRIFVPGRD